MYDFLILYLKKSFAGWFMLFYIYMYLCVFLCKLREVLKIKKSMNLSDFVDIGDDREGKTRAKDPCFEYE